MDSYITNGCLFNRGPAIYGNTIEKINNLKLDVEKAETNLKHAIIEECNKYLSHIHPEGKEYIEIYNCDGIEINIISIAEDIIRDAKLLDVLDVEEYEKIKIDLTASTMEHIIRKLPDQLLKELARYNDISLVLLRKTFNHETYDCQRMAVIHKFRYNDDHPDIYLNQKIWNLGGNDNITLSMLCGIEEK